MEQTQFVTLFRNMKYFLSQFVYIVRSNVQECTNVDAFLRSILLLMVTFEYPRFLEGGRDYSAKEVMLLTGLLWHIDLHFD